MKYISIALLLFAPIILAKVSVHLSFYPSEIGKPLQGLITVNNARNQNISTMVCKITSDPIIENGYQRYYLAEKSFVLQKIPANEERTFDFSIRVANDKVEYLTEKLRTECLIGEETISAVFFLKTEWFRMTWDNAKIEHALKRINTLYLSIGGGGKSNEYNVICTSLSDAIVFPAPARKGKTHCTEELKRYSLTDKNDVYDPVGFSLDERFRSEKYLRYLTLGIVPVDVNLVLMNDIEWVAFMQKLDVAYSKYLNLPFEKQLAMRMHSIVLFVPFDAIYNDKIMSQFMSVFTILTTKLHYSPMIVLNFVQNQTPEAVITAKNDLATILGIQIGQILTSSVYTNETQKCFDIDKSSLVLLDKTFVAANEKIKNLVTEYNNKLLDQQGLPMIGIAGSVTLAALIIIGTTLCCCRKKATPAPLIVKEVDYLPVKGERATVQEQIELYMTKQLPVVFKEPSDN